MSWVEKSACGVSFRVVDPATYAFAAYEFDDELEFKERFWSGLRPGDVVMDVGASYGGWTLPALAQGAAVIAVEPSDVSGSVLRQSVALNFGEARSTFYLERCLLWDSELHVPEKFRNAAVRNFGGTDDVPVTSLDQLRYAPDRIKMDVEGAEHAVILGGQTTLKTFKPILIIEDHDKPAEAPEAHLVPYAVGVRARVVRELTLLGYDYTFHFLPGGGNPYIVAVHPEGAQFRAGH
jgi:FkbM family methyltransferase